MGLLPNLASDLLPRLYEESHERANAYMVVAAIFALTLGAVRAFVPWQPGNAAALASVSQRSASPWTAIADWRRSAFLHRVRRQGFSKHPGRTQRNAL